MPARDDKKAEELVGQKISKLKVLKFIGRIGKNKVKYYLCECDCGTKKEISISYLRSRPKKGQASCGCALQAHYDNTTIDLINKVFGKLTVHRKTDMKSCGKTTTEAFWECVCECGEKTIVRSSDLRRGNIKSCGCNKNNLEHKRKYEPIMAAATAAFRKYNNIEKGDNLTIEQFIELAQQNCHYCGAEPNIINNTYLGRITITDEEKEKYNFIRNGLDRINNTLPHTLENCVPCCTQCNTAKMDYSEKDFREWLIRAYNHYIK